MSKAISLDLKVKAKKHTPVFEERDRQREREKVRDPRKNFLGYLESMDVKFDLRSQESSTTTDSLTKQLTQGTKQGQAKETKQAAVVLKG